MISTKLDSAQPLPPLQAPSSRRQKGPKITRDPVRRTKAANDLAVRTMRLSFNDFVFNLAVHPQGSIRLHLEHLVGRDSLLISTVTRDQAIAFAAGWDIDGGASCDPCCTASHFRYDLLGPPHSPWNTSAARVFCDDFIDFHELERTPVLTDDLLRGFFSRIKGLRRAYKIHHLSQAHQKDHARRARQAARKANVRHNWDPNPGQIDTMVSAL